MGKGVTGRLVARGALAMSFCAALGACASAAHAARTARQAMPVSTGGPGLSVRMQTRPLSAHSDNLVVYLVARRRLPAVRVIVRSPDAGLRITPGCRFHPLRPPRAAPAHHPLPALPPVPLCSVVLTAAAGRYPIDIRILDEAGRDLVSPVHAVVAIGAP